MVITDNSEVDADELNHGRKTLQESISELKLRLSKKDIIERNNQRIKELETQLKNQSEELALLEGIEFTITAFSKARIEAVECKINRMFKIVKFKMFEQQINGGEVETCEAMADGKPFSTQNNAMKINMGLDIINAICEFEGTTAPIIVDNAESVNRLIDTKSQLIRLVVTEDESLVINN